ncbi:hypothetical protein [Ancylobacter polymorphus]|uniref:Uncharacterized protein n=1 Tax=Ancylobacter polymorphus TaxID=223390 RepID=A0A9E7A906_9HYPH|nr:hypothetical protein [Ancylobacter polymorphus]UOK73024.1 hypothetical protein K9D25_10145 [Ancylobacter polymorphus]
MTVNIIAITPSANLTAINAVLEAMGRGPTNITLSASTDPDAKWDDTPTHYYMSDQGAPDWLAAAFMAFQNGDLPALAPDYIWGEDGCISSSDALEAITPSNFAVAYFNDGFSPQQQEAAALASYSVPLYKLPPPPE